MAGHSTKMRLPCSNCALCLLVLVAACSSPVVHATHVDGFWSMLHNLTDVFSMSTSTTGSSKSLRSTNSQQPPKKRQEQSSHVDISVSVSVSVSVSQTCFERQDEIVVHFTNNLQDENLPSANDWVGLYYEDFLPTEEPIVWMYTCGSTQLEDCYKANTTTTLMGSLTLAAPHQMEPGRYVAVLARDVDDDEEEAYHIKAVSDEFIVVRNTCQTSNHRQLQSSQMADIIQQARRDILELIGSDVSLPGRWLRMVFHDCVGGRCDGCVQMRNPEHAGIDVAMGALRDIADKYPLSRADLWVLAAFVGVEFLMPEEDRISFRFEHWGRTDCRDSPTSGPDPMMCNANFGTNAMVAFFNDQFGFSTSELAAIMGAHTIGVLRQNVLGYDGPNGWVTNNLRFDNEYHQELIGANGDLRMAPNWKMNLIRNSGPLPDRWQWEGFPGGSKIVMLNSDVALVRQLDSSNRDQMGRVSCNFIDRDNTGNKCPSASSSLMEPMIHYASDNRAFLRDFYRAFVKMVDVGYGIDNDSCDSNNVCRLRR